MKKAFGRVFSFLNTTLGLWVLTVTLAAGLSLYVGHKQATEAQFDEQATKDIIALQRKIHSWFLTLSLEEEVPGETHDVEYKANLEFYRDVESDLSSIEFRLTNAPNAPDLLSRLLDLLNERFERFRQVHQKEGRVSPTAPREFAKQFDKALSFLLTFEYALKSGNNETEVLAESVKLFR